MVRDGKGGVIADIAHKKTHKHTYTPPTTPVYRNTLNTPLYRNILLYRNIPLYRNTPTHLYNYRNTGHTSII